MYDEVIKIWGKQPCGWPVSKNAPHWKKKEPDESLRVKTRRRIKVLFIVAQGYVEVEMWS